VDVSKDHSALAFGAKQCEHSGNGWLVIRICGARSVGRRSGFNVKPDDASRNHQALKG
jgi:hypothetical protein